MLQFQKAIGIEAKKTLGIIRAMILACGAEMGRNGNGSEAIAIKYSVVKSSMALQLKTDKKEEAKGGGIGR